MPISDFRECQAAEALGLFGERREDARIALLIAAVQNMIAHDVGAVSSLDNLFQGIVMDHLQPETEPPSRQLTGQEMLEIMLALQAIHGGRPS